MSDDRAYRILLAYDEEKQRFLARVPELGLETEGENRTAAMVRAEKGIEERIEQAAVSGEKLPPPNDTSALGGPLTLNLVGPVRRELEYRAKMAQVAPEQMAAQLLALALGTAPPSRARVEEPAQNRGPRDGNSRDDRGPPQRQGQPNRGRREGYRPEIDNQADFLAYVRDMEKGRGGGRR